MGTFHSSCPTRFTFPRYKRGKEPGSGISGEAGRRAMAV
jgi:hypothetical protein